MDWQNPICSPLQQYYSISTLKNNIHRVKATPRALLQDPNLEAVICQASAYAWNDTHTMIHREVQCQQSMHGWLQEAKSSPSKELIRYKRKREELKHLSTEWY